MTDFSAPFSHSAYPVAYQIEPLDNHAHLFAVRLTIARPAALQTVSLPVWIPGSYLVREFAKHLQCLRAFQAIGGKALQPLAITAIDKCTWQIQCQPGQPLVLTYQIYAHDNSVRSAWLDAERGFFNGTSVCLRVEGQENAAHGLELLAPVAANAKGWQAASALTAVDVDTNGFGSYAADNYDTLVDCPVAMGHFWSGNFTACGIEHRFVVSGAAPSFDGARLLADTQKIVEVQIAFWHPDLAANPPPHRNYLFMLHAVADGYGGLEHKNSTALICNRADLPRIPGQGEESSKTPEGYTTLCGLISHEYFHTWCVKRLRPAEFAHFHYERENYTELLWFFEGFTSYYDDLLLRRAGLIDNAGYLKLLGKTINQVAQTPGQQVQSLAQASRDAWIKYYRPDANTPNATVSYYTKGALVALCLDLTLRQESRNSPLGETPSALHQQPACLDDVMRGLWQRCSGGPMQEADLLAVLQEVSGRSFAPELAAWVHGCEALPVQSLLAAQGVATHEEPAQLAQRLGLRVAEKNGSISIKTVLRGGAAEAAGFAPGDEWLGIALESGEKASQNMGWRIAELADIAAIASLVPGSVLGAIVVRDQQILQLTLVWPAAATTGRLVVQGESLLNQWLAL